MRKIITLGIMLLFLGMTISSSTGFNLEEQSTIATFDGNILYVGGDGPGNYTKIRDAIDNASDGDTVFVFDNSSPYYENLIVDKSINLIGEDKNTTIINGSHSWKDIVYISTDWVTISGFTLQNIGYYSAGIHLSSNYSIIRDNIIDHYSDYSLYLIGIQLDYSNNNTIIDNNVSIRGYFMDDYSQCVGISIWHSDNNIITGNNISNNFIESYGSGDGDGYGIILGYSRNTTIIGNIISKNDFGIYLHYSLNNNISGNSIFSNSYEGISIYWSNNNSISHNNFSNNYCYGINLYNSYSTKIYCNSFFKDGLYVIDSYFNNVEGNTVNNRSLVYLENKSDHIITAAGQVILVKCNNITVENLNLSNTSVGVELWETNNCKIRNNNCSNSFYGIYIRHSSDIIIQGNNINSNKDYGVYLYNTSNNTISSNSVNWNKRYGIAHLESNDNTINNNNISNSIYGLYLDGYYGSGSGSKNNIISNNTIFSNRGDGIRIGKAYNNNITSNIISKNSNGIYSSEFASHNIIKENIISNNNGNGVFLGGSYNISVISNEINSNQRYGISLFTGDNHNVLNNSLSKNGLRVYKSNNNNVENNFVNEKPLVYLENKSDRVITDAGQVVLVCSSNITVDNLNLSNASIGVQLCRSNYCKIRNNNCSDGLYGLLFRKSSNITIIGNSIISNDYEGICLDYTSNYNISNNIITSNNRDGIEIKFSTNITVAGNNISKNDDGIHLFRTSNSNITRNNISNNENGMDISSSSNNTIYHNNFIDNEKNAWCKGDNIWDNGYPSGGNYWDDYNGKDLDGDGIGDTPYPIPGGDNEDRYPLMYPSFDDPPDAPIIDGSPRGKVGVEYEYNFSLSDSDDDSMYLRVDWGNGTPGPWQGPYDSDTTVQLNHTWTKKGKYTIRAQAKDIYDVESEWGYLEVTMPKNKVSSNTVYSIKSWRDT